MVFASRNRHLTLAALMFATTAATHTAAAPVLFKERALTDLIQQVPKLLASQDKKTGRFGTGIWIVTDQNEMLPLAAAWSYRNDRNPYFHKPKVLDAIMAAGDALIADQDAKGQWEFRKKDGSTWGPIYMPWTYSRWIRSFALIRDAMPAQRRAYWEKGLLLGFSGISAQISTAKVQNIPAHHAMGLYFAGVVFDRPAWRKQAADFLHKVAAEQHSDGYWSEHVGPVVSYGFVYVDALGTYLAASKDESVRPVLRKSALFHTYFTYPDGSDVETVDERNPYHAGVRVPNVGFTFSPEGRSYLARQMARHTAPLSADDAASLLLWGEEGEGTSVNFDSDFEYVFPSGTAAVRRRGPWFMAVSALTAPVPNSRWIQDRQNFVSVFHEKTGLLIGGGNTKLQPRWSNFTIGDIELMKHKAGDENPNFLPPAGLVHVPAKATLLRDGGFGVELDYGSGHRGRILLNVVGPDQLEYSWSGQDQMAAHITLIPHVGAAVTTAGGSATLTDAAFQLNPREWIEYAGVRISLPSGVSLRWPVKPHDPYRKDGRSEISQSRLVLDAPAKGTITVRVKP